jgi:hypothetical protein
MKTQVERILQSETLRNADALRRLLAYLAEKSIAGDADQLKEYVVGLEAFGKPPDYDPRQDSIVRLQVGRLRQKLTEYYLTEGKDDPIVIDLPKGHFKLSFETRPGVAPSRLERAAPQPWRRVALALGFGLLVALAWGTYSAVRLAQERQRDVASSSAWTPELNALWESFLTPERPLVVGIGSPLFLILGKGQMFRDVTINRWEDALHSASVAAIRKTLQNPPMQPRYHYVPADELNAVFLLGKLLAPRQPHISLAKSTQLSLQQLEANNMLMIGSPALFDGLLRALPFQQEFAQERSGIRNLHPRAGEPEFFTDQNSTGTSEDGDAYTLITHAPGPLGIGDVASFTSSTIPGRLTAVQWFTDPALARTLAGKLRDPEGKLPRYFQVVVRSKFMDTVPVETSYVTYRAIQLSARSATGP